MGSFESKLGLNILLAESDIGWMDLIRKFLELAQCNVTCCTDSFCALHELRSKPFDLLIIDVSMPHAESIWIAKNIRDINSKTPIFFIATDLLELDRKRKITEMNSRCHLFEGPVIVRDLLEKAYLMFNNHGQYSN